MTVIWDLPILCHKYSHAAIYLLVKFTAIIQLFLNIYFLFNIIYIEYEIRHINISPLSHYLTLSHSRNRIVKYILISKAIDLITLKWFVSRAEYHIVHNTLSERILLKIKSIDFFLFFFHFIITIIYTSQQWFLSSNRISWKKLKKLRERDRWRKN